MISESEVRRKRRLVGLLSITCTVAAVIQLIIDPSSALGAAFLRVGLLLGAFWLALPARDRPAAWARVSPWTVGLVIVMALALQRIRFFLPVFIVGALIGWVVRPRKKNGQ